MLTVVYDKLSPRGYTPHRQQKSRLSSSPQREPHVADWTEPGGVIGVLQLEMPGWDSLSCMAASRNGILSREECAISDDDLYFVRISSDSLSQCCRFARSWYIRKVKAIDVVSEPAALLLDI